LLLFDLLPLLIILLPLLLFDLLLQHPLQVLLLMLLPLIYVLGDLHEPVHRPRYRRPWVLEGLLERGIQSGTGIALPEDRHCWGLVHHHEVPRGLI
jgi:hypothetical protein